jgi:hypothetical protein
MEFEALLESFESSSVGYGPHFKVPQAVFEVINPQCKDKRVICYLNQTLRIHSGMMPKDGYHFILLNQALLKQHGMVLGEIISVRLEADTSDYGMEISEEFREVLFSDPEGSEWFHKLTSGKQRTLIHLVNKIKNSQLKIERSFVILEHLKKQRGKLDYKILDQDIKDFRESMKI